MQTNTQIAPLDAPICSASLDWRSNPSAETRERMRMAQLGKKHSKEHREKISKSLMGRQHSEETREKLRLAQLGRKASDEVKEKLRLAHLGNIPTSETREKMSLAATGRVAKTPKTMKGPTNAKAITSIIRSPTGRTYHVKNVAHFVRENNHMFAPEELEVKKNMRGECLAIVGIRSVARVGKSAVPTWKGWTRVSAAECNLNDGVDLLGREIPLPNVNVVAPPTLDSGLPDDAPGG